MNDNKRKDRVEKAQEIIKNIIGAGTIRSNLTEMCKI